MVLVAEFPLFTGVPHFPQNSWSEGMSVAHDGQRLTWLSLPAQLVT